jgi:hypothetical protein
MFVRPISLRSPISEAHPDASHGNSTFPGCGRWPYPGYSLLFPSGSLQDQIRDLLGMRYQGQVPGVDFDGVRVHALGQEALQVQVISTRDMPC